MQKNEENYEQISLFADQDTVIDECGRKIKWNMRDHAKKLGCSKNFTTTYERKCVYQVCGEDNNPHCQVVKMADNTNRIGPNESNCGTNSCPYYIPFNKETK